MDETGDGTLDQALFGVSLHPAFIPQLHISPAHEDDGNYDMSDSLVVVAHGAPDVDQAADKENQKPGAATHHTTPASLLSLSYTSLPSTVHSGGISNTGTPAMSGFQGYSQSPASRLSPSWLASSSSSAHPSPNVQAQPYTASETPCREIIHVQHLNPPPHHLQLSGFPSLPASALGETRLTLPAGSRASTKQGRSTLGSPDTLSTPITSSRHRPSPLQHLHTTARVRYSESSPSCCLLGSTPGSANCTMILKVVPWLCVVCRIQEPVQMLIAGASIQQTP